MLRPVPSRPPGPVDPAEALGFVAAELPSVDASAQAAFAAVVLGGSDRSAVPGLSPERVGEALARARKEVRRAVVALPGSGWCERAERHVSDRLDDALSDTRLLDAHLANCERCVEHERRLVAAQDALVAGFVSSSSSVSVLSPPLATIAEPPALTVAPEPVAAPPAPASPEPVAAPRRSLSASGIAWGFLAVLAVLLTVAAIAIAIAGAVGAF